MRPWALPLLQVTSERVCVPQLPGGLDSAVLCGNGFRVVAESKAFYIEAVPLAATREIQPVPSVGGDFATIVPANFLSILDNGDPDKAKILFSLNIEVLKASRKNSRERIYGRKRQRPLPQMRPTQQFFTRSAGASIPPVVTARKHPLASALFKTMRQRSEQRNRSGSINFILKSKNPGKAVARLR